MEPATARHLAACQGQRDAKPRFSPWHFGLNQNHTTTPSVSCLTPLKFSPCSLKFETWNTNRTSDTLVVCNMQPIAATFVAHSCRQESSDAHQQSSNFSWIKAQKRYSTKIKTSSLSVPSSVCVNSLEIAGKSRSK